MIQRIILGAVLASALMGAAGASAAAPWQEAVGKDAMTDQWSFTAKRAGDGAQLVLTCSDRVPGVIDVMVWADDLLRVRPALESQNAEYRIDDDPQIMTRWVYFEHIARAPRPTDTLLRVLSGASKLTVRLYDFKGVARTYVFDLAGIQTALGHARLHCKMDPGG